MDWHIEKARQSAKRNAAGLDLERVLQVLADRRDRVVRSSAELRQVILEHLEVLSRWLTQEHSQKFALWNTTSSATRNPKRETDICIWYAHGLSLLLQDVGGVINREVSVYERPGLPGVRNDIRVQVSLPGADVLTVVVEVKCAWNREILTGLSGQLVRRYLEPGGHQDGIYLAIWADPTSISNASTRSRFAEHSRAVLKRRLLKQASEAAPLRIDAVVHDITVRWPTLP